MATMEKLRERCVRWTSGVYMSIESLGGGGARKDEGRERVRSVPRMGTLMWVGMIIDVMRKLRERDVVSIHGGLLVERKDHRGWLCGRWR
jgi:hypothetical protein